MAATKSQKTNQTDAIGTDVVTEHTFKGCACDCGENITSKRTFRPGHDARLVSKLVEDLISGDLKYTNGRLGLQLQVQDDIQYHIDQMSAAMDKLFTRPLANKMVTAAHKAWADSLKAKGAAQRKADAKAERLARVEARKATLAAKAAAPKAAPKKVSGGPKLTIVASSPVVVEGEPMKIGRWTYPTRTVDGVLERNIKSNGKGAWIVVE